MALSRLPAAVRRSAVGELGARKRCGPVAPAEPLGWAWEDACVDCNMKSDSKEPDSEYEPNYSTHFITYSQGQSVTPQSDFKTCEINIFCDGKALCRT